MQFSRFMLSDHIQPETLVSSNSYLEATIELLSRSLIPAEAHFYIDPNLKMDANLRWFDQTPVLSMREPPLTARSFLALAHEIGHYVLRHYNLSTPEYILEYEAEQFALETMRRYEVLDPGILIHSMFYVHYHCAQREKQMPYPERLSWSRQVIDWCGFIPVSPHVMGTSVNMQKSRQRIHNHVYS